jgi:hypothetical protein
MVGALRRCRPDCAPRRNRSLAADSGRSPGPGLTRRSWDRAEIAHELPRHRP